MLALIIINMIMGIIFVVACHTMKGFGKNMKGAEKQPAKINRKPRLL